MMFNALTVAFGLAAVASAHMEMKYPPPFKSKYNPNSGQDVDYGMTSPLDASGANFPCKGYQSLFGTDKGKSVATWEAGQTYNLTITGGANHEGGSCQVSLSQDKGKTFKVIHSYIGNCPAMGDSDWKFTLPADTPSGDQILAWTWFNKVGNREMYMNCAAITVKGKAGAKRDALASRPDMFVANVGNGCQTLESKDVEFPDPGPDVTNNSQGTAPPTCAKGSSGSSSGSSGSSGSADSGSSGASGSAGSGSSGSSGSGYGSGSGSDGSGAAAAAPSAPASSVAGGVFITKAPAATAPATTMATITQAAPTDPGSAAAAPSPVSPPAGTGSGASSGGAAGSSGSGSAAGGGEGGQQAGAACSSEGMWNCVGGTSYQRCASGKWTAVMPVAGGTTCKAGQSQNFAMIKKRGGPRLFTEAWRI